MVSEIFFEICGYSPGVSINGDGFKFWLSLVLLLESCIFLIAQFFGGFWNLFTVEDGSGVLHADELLVQFVLDALLTSWFASSVSLHESPVSSLRWVSLEDDSIEHGAETLHDVRRHELDHVLLDALLGVLRGLMSRWRDW